MTDKQLAELIQSATTSVLDGRTSFPRFRQAQLGLLHGEWLRPALTSPCPKADVSMCCTADALITNQAELVSALCADTGRVATEAKLEIALALNKVKAQYDQLDFAKTVKQAAEEYQIGVVRKPVGLVIFLAESSGEWAAWFVAQGELG